MTMKPTIVDLYHGDEVEDWNSVYAAGIQGVIHKATQGTKIVDKTYASRRTRALKAGLLWGAYHFADDSDVEAQVAHFLEVAQPDDNTLLALDYEPNGQRTMSLAQAKRFMELVYEKTGQRPVLYSGNLIKETLTKPDPFFNQHRLWLAQYGNSPRLPVGWSNYFAWQFTGDGVGPTPHEVEGISTRGIDLNLFGGKDLAAEWAPNDRPATVAPEVSTTTDKPAAAPISVLTIAKSAYASRSAWAWVAGIFWMVWGVLTDWAKATLDWVLWAFDLIPKVKEEVDTVVSPLTEMAAWFKLNVTNIALTISAVCCVVFLIRHLLLRVQAQPEVSKPQ